MRIQLLELTPHSPYAHASTRRFFNATAGVSHRSFNLMQSDWIKSALRIMVWIVMRRVDAVGRMARRYSVSTPCSGMDQKLATSEFQQGAQHKSEQTSEQLRLWLETTAKKDAQAFRQLYDAVSPKLLGYALRVLGKRELAEEALQESFVSIWNSAATYKLVWPRR